MAPDKRTSAPARFFKPLLIAGCLIAAVAVFFLWEEHESHILGALFWLLLLACPLIHIFMHRGHGHGAHKHQVHGESDESAQDDHRGFP